MRRAMHWWQTECVDARSPRLRHAAGKRVLALSVIGMLLSAPTVAQTVNFSPTTLSLSPAGPYSVPRDAAVGSQVASALATATATGISCALIQTATVNGTEMSAGSGIYLTSVSGI